MFNVSSESDYNCCNLKGQNLPNNKNLLSFCVDDVFTPAECAQLINKSESVGYINASIINKKTGEEYTNIKFRNSLRCIIDDVDLSKILEARILHLIPKEYRGKKFNCINPRFRFLKYNDSTHHFVPHTDACYSTDTTMSMITILIYLNSNYTGARTSLNFDKKTIENEIVPKTGMVYLMDQDILHSVPPLITGCKYAIRTELMYWI